MGWVESEIYCRPMLVGDGGGSIGKMIIVLLWGKGWESEIYGRKLNEGQINNLAVIFLE